jgi:hypothetical protein
MLSRTIAVACVAIVFIASGCDSTPTHESVMKERIEKAKKMVEIMKGVKDEPTAKAAESKMKDLEKEMAAVDAKQSKLGEPSAEEQKRLEEKYGPELAKLMGEMMSEGMRIALDPNLSKHLKDAMPAKP